MIPRKRRRRRAYQVARAQIRPVRLHRTLLFERSVARADGAAAEPDTGRAPLPDEHLDGAPRDDGSERS